MIFNKNLTAKIFKKNNLSQFIKKNKSKKKEEIWINSLVQKDKNFKNKKYKKIFPLSTINCNKIHWVL